MALTDLLNAFSPGAGAGGGLTAAPGQGLTTEPNAPRSLTASSAIMQVPGFEGTGIRDIIGQAPFDANVGGQQQGGLGERLGGIMGASGFADPTIGNIARSMALGLSIASPMSPFGMLEGLATSELGLPGYASPIIGALAGLAGLPGPINLSPFAGAGQYPKQLIDALQNAVPYSREWYNIQSQLQQYAASHGSDQIHHDFSAGIGAGALPGTANIGGHTFGLPGNEIAGTLAGGGGGMAASGGGAQPGSPGSEGASARSGGVF